jgi:hypothetical protein
MFSDPFLLLDLHHARAAELHSRARRFHLARLLRRHDPAASESHVLAESPPMRWAPREAGDEVAALS